MRPSDVARFVALAAIWGFSYLFFRVLAPVLGPIVTAMLRVLIGGGVLVAYCRFTRFDGELRRYWRQYVVIGIVNSTIPFVLFAFAALHIPASYSAILNSTTPLFTALLAVWFLGERLTPLKIGGLCAGMFGVALVSGAGPAVPDAWFGAAVSACLVAAFCYAISGIYTKKNAAHAKPLAIAGWSQVFAGCVLLPIAPFAPPAGEATPFIIANVLGLALVCSAIAYLLFYRLIADLGPTRALTVTFLIPIFGMLWGALFLGETITLPMIAGCALVIGGATLVLRPAPLAVRAAPN